MGVNIELPMINGINYSWASVRIAPYGVPLTGVTAINYGEKETKENNYGAGRYPISRGYGSIETNCSITLYKDTLEALQKAAPNGRITDIPASDVPVVFVNRAGKYMKEVLKNFEFTENKTEVQQGDTKILVTIECIISHVEWAK